ncbi:HAMP domain-containing histidine kinase [Myxococcota bacterium]|nr:HAMP domain-containing histidine kinase [Myxococcota bacterium]MCZ7617072.1 HAMP domain-containing histidine kinase [Myxococcota bacterium]
MEREVWETPASAPARRGARRRRPAASDPSSPRIDTELQRLDRLAGVGRLAAETAHEVRNALTAVKTLLQLLPTRGDDPEFCGPFRALVSEEVDRTERLLDALLEQARGDTTDASAQTGRRCDPAAALLAVVQLVAQQASERGVHVVTDLEPELPAAAMSGDALRQVLLNLALNALEASATGGDVRFVARWLDRAGEAGSVLDITIEDRGPGVPEALRARVFEPWFSAGDGRPGGLGLAIARDLVEAAHGSIAIDDRPGGGARIQIRIPVAPAGIPPPPT